MSLALVDNLVARIEPVPFTGDGFDVSVDPKTNRVVVSFRGEPIESGVQFYSMKGKGKINPRTGVFDGNNTTYRAVFAGQHKDIQL